MSMHSKATRITAPAITARKGGEKLVCLTAYTAPVAEILDDKADLLLSATAWAWWCMGCRARSA